ncbi:MAG: hypothetical protein EAZ90_08555 [Oscillatoriales cyanobacterium]|nr:MAG: hypothetical protein EAZ90_08555 [Oscillatoriales cyanobacterium]TAE54942.1 MAG: hypothetical protein EAZ88_07665 [Oscillatoriales cyanobacterium]TAE63074.1 MAG: hypothetical protein EAZ86_29665 [Oscillatoriales cyanobacterium]TAF91349.1 MAG: hypothetical protein EAZ49_06310 [Oscillatoriales cyanobacterium]TAG67240.1 MAG: hypothetical protein EAZ25_08525 [Oscillatoriales cyanobacterium]
MGWASRPSLIDGRDAHPTIIKIVSYLILIPYREHLSFARSIFYRSASVPARVLVQTSTRAGTLAL